MSRGHGHVERAILEALRWGRGGRGKFPYGADVDLLAHYVQCGEAMGSVACPHSKQRILIRGRFAGWSEATGFHPTRSDLESVRRALRNLRMQGLVVRHKLACGRFEYITPRRIPNCPG
jgi:hypothetical protein